MSINAIAFVIMQAKMENVVKSGDSKNSNYWNCIHQTSHELLTINILDGVPSW